MSQSQYYRWRDLFLEGAKMALETGKISEVELQLQNKISEYEQITGKQAVEIQILKNCEFAEIDKVERIKMLVKEGFKITYICKALNMARSSFYALIGSKGYPRDIQTEDTDDKYIVEKIKQIVAEHPYWGYRRRSQNPNLQD